MRVPYSFAARSRDVGRSCSGFGTALRPLAAHPSVAVSFVRTWSSATGVNRLFSGFGMKRLMRAMLKSGVRNSLPESGIGEGAAQLFAEAGKPPFVNPGLKPLAPANLTCVTAVADRSHERCSLSRQPPCRSAAASQKAARSLTANPLGGLEITREAAVHEPRKRNIPFRVQLR